MSHEKRLRQRRSDLIVFLVFSFTCMIVCIIPYLNLVSQAPNIRLTQTMIGQNILETIVPGSADDIHYTSTSGFQSVHTKIRFTLPSEALREFILGFCPDMKFRDGGYIPLRNDETLNWWKPEDIKIYSIGSCVEQNIEIYSIVIDKSNSQYYIVYVEL